MKYIFFTLFVLLVCLAADNGPYIHTEADLDGYCSRCHGIVDASTDTQIRIDTRTNKMVALYGVSGDLCLIGTGETIDCGWLYQPPHILPCSVKWPRAYAR